MKKVYNWGNYPKISATVAHGKFAYDVPKIVQSYENIIARGNGRCYGDSSLNPQIFSTKGLNKVLSFDEKKGIIRCEAGVLLSDILQIIIPKGYFLPVTPGTKFITIGGAIAADVHGKNHHVVGCFSNFIDEFDLVIENGSIITCSPQINQQLFWETCGGMGLTGIILRATLRLHKIETTYIRQKSIKARNLEEVMKLFEKHKNYTYSVAWIDCLAQGKDIGKSILMLGEHASINEVKASQKVLSFRGKQVLNIPFYFPKFFLNSFSIKAFNFLYYHKQLKKNKDNIVHYEPYFYPLDSIGNWNRMYGSNGFTQYQFVLPLKYSEQGLREILSFIAESGEGSFLAVLKLFGNAAKNAVMSFPEEGYTLALDFKISKNVFQLLNKLDEIVKKYNGKIYLAKDARMTADFFHETYINKVSTTPKFQSMQSKRLKL